MVTGCHWNIGTIFSFLYKANTSRLLENDKVHISMKSSKRQNLSVMWAMEGRRHSVLWEGSSNKSQQFRQCLTLKPIYHNEEIYPSRIVTYKVVITYKKSMMGVFLWCGMSKWLMRGKGKVRTLRKDLIARWPHKKITKKLESIAVSPKWHAEVYYIQH